MLNIYIFVQIGSYILAKITNITTLQTFLKIVTKFVIKPQTQQENHLYSPRFKIGGALEGAVLKIKVFAQIGSTNLAKITNITTYVKLKIET